MFGKLKLESLPRAQLSLNKNKTPSCVSKNKKNKSPGLIEIEYLNLYTDLSQINGLYISKDPDISMYCESNKCFVDIKELDKIKDNKDFIIKGPKIIPNNNNSDTIINDPKINEQSPNSDMNNSSIEKQLPNLDLNDSLNNVKNCDFSSVFKISEIAYVSDDLSDPQPLLYVTIKIFDYSIKALIDSGASRSFMGKINVDLQRKLGLVVEKNYGKIQLANSEVQTVSEENFCPYRIK